MNKKGFTLVELLAVLVILSFIIVIVATKGFGAFDSTKEKINEQNYNLIKEAANLVMTEVLYCDDNLDYDLVAGLGYSSCKELKDRAESIDGLKITLEYLIDNEYIDAESVKGIFEKDSDYTLLGMLNNNEIMLTKILGGEAKLKNFNGNGFAKTEPFSDYINQIVSISFVDYLNFEQGIEINGNKYIDITETDSKDRVYAWLEKNENDNSKYDLYVGADNKQIYASVNCSNLFRAIPAKKLDLSNFDTSKVTTMQAMFMDMSSLEILELGKNFDTSEVGNMQYMFASLENINHLDLGDKFNTSKVKNMMAMFAGMEQLTSLNLGNRFDTSIVENMSYLFNNVLNLKELDLGDKFNTKSVTDMSSMFANMSSLDELNFETNFNTSRVNNMYRMFYNIYSLSELDLSQFDMRQVSNKTEMFLNEIGSYNAGYLNLYVSADNEKAITDGTSLSSDVIVMIK